MSILSDLIPRQAHHALARISQAFPVLALTGPRQSGKTTLARSSFPDKPYRTLEDPETRQLAVADPRAFLAQFPDGAVLDELTVLLVLHGANLDANGGDESLDGINAVLQVALTDKLGVLSGNKEDVAESECV